MPDLEPTLANTPTDLAPTLPRAPRPVPLPHEWNVGDELPHEDFPSYQRTDRVVIEPQVGMGITMGCGSDSYPGTIVKVAPNGRTIWVVGDGHAYVGPPKPYGDPGSDDDKVYTFTGGAGCPYTLRKDGKYHREGQALKARDYVFLGRRHYYYDPHF